MSQRTSSRPLHFSPAFQLVLSNNFRQLPTTVDHLKSRLCPCLEPGVRGVPLRERTVRTPKFQDNYSRTATHSSTSLNSHSPYADNVPGAPLFPPFRSTSQAWQVNCINNGCMSAHEMTIIECTLAIGQKSKFSFDIPTPVAHLPRASPLKCSDT